MVGCRGGAAVIAETVTLFGLPIVGKRTVGLDRVDRRLARVMFVRHALVFGDWETRHEFVAGNDQFVERVRLLEARVRRVDLLDDEALFEFYDERVGRDVTSARHFDRWWRDARDSDPNLLDLTPSVLSNRRGIDLADYPDTWRPDGWTPGDAEYRIAYRFEPDTALDGAALSIPLTALNQLDDTGFDWLIPGYRPELVALLARSLPKDVRRNLIPMNETAAAATERLGPVEGRLVDALARAIAEVSGEPIDPEDFDLDRLPKHLRLHIVVVDEDGNVVDAGDDLSAIRVRQSASTRAALADASPVTERRDILRWDIGRLDRVVEHRGKDGHVVRSYPTLLDRATAWRCVSSTTRSSSSGRCAVGFAGCC